jgi:hypothetical protein
MAKSISRREFNELQCLSAAAMGFGSFTHPVPINPALTWCAREFGEAGDSQAPIKHAVTLCSAAETISGAHSATV